jgi:hypothetical protein
MFPSGDDGFGAARSYVRKQKPRSDDLDGHTAGDEGADTRAAIRPARHDGGWMTDEKPEDRAPPTQPTYIDQGSSLLLTSLYSTLSLPLVENFAVVLGNEEDITTQVPIAFFFRVIFLFVCFRWLLLPLPSTRKFCR